MLAINGIKNGVWYNGSLKDYNFQVEYARTELSHICLVGSHTSLTVDNVESILTIKRRHSKKKRKKKEWDQIEIGQVVAKPIIIAYRTSNFSTSVSFYVSRAHWLLSVWLQCRCTSDAPSIVVGWPAAWCVISSDYHPPHTLIRSQLEQDRGQSANTHSVCLL